MAHRSGLSLLRCRRRAAIRSGPLQRQVIPPCQPIGDGKYQWNLKGIDPVLYRLLELRAAGPDEAVWIVEGEKDADRLASLGLVATTDPMGPASGGIPTLSNCGAATATSSPTTTVGADHAQAVARSLAGKADSVRAVAPEPAREGRRIGLARCRRRGVRARRDRLRVAGVVAPRRSAEERENGTAMANPTATATTISRPSRTSSSAWSRSRT